MDIELENLPIIDWELGLKLTGQNKELAQDMLLLLARNLPDELSAINEYYNMHNNAELLKCVHKLHGAIAYCGLPRLKTVLHYLETNLKNNKIDTVPDLIKQLNAEVDSALKEVKTIN